MDRNKQGYFVISLDFELYWGIRDKKSVDEYGQNIKGVWSAVPRLLQMFEKYNLHATWAVVGAMLSKDKEDFQKYIPEIKPKYIDENLSPYGEFYKGLADIEDLYVYGNELVQKVIEYNGQEIGTHTFSHYYCLENKKDRGSFFSDLTSAIKISEDNGIKIKTIIFPRHQVNENYLKGIKKHDIYIYRGTEKIWYHSAARGQDEGIVKRAFRYVDYFIKIGSHHCQNIEEVKRGDIFQIRASRWLRPYNKKNKIFDFLKLNRIKNQMKYAAKNGKIFHLWFHPHDIGINQDENFKYLEIIFEYYLELKHKYNFESKNMYEISEIANGLK
ncbi:polysaccharide deacetylase family protein [Riemerella columbipharyngis]|uniref:Polysaccharide deacetylase n=1 Tax=Riemerella columbipharyngis TaxID=1071918 RepID=A0A1G7B381_9FLAO|nr:DUF2334 domain-containing protein [Riemerella columbipharyngis]SDE21568.1 Polysaccharide deacetylase [Riemerella columbipharyngis]